MCVANLFLYSAFAERGDPGNSGLDGIPGRQGFPGAKGAPGDYGDDGLPGNILSIICFVSHSIMISSKSMAQF